MPRKEKDKPKDEEVVLSVDLSLDALITVLNAISKNEGNQNINLKKIPNEEWLRGYLLAVWKQLKLEANPKSKNKEVLQDPKLDNTRRTLAHGLTAWIGDKPYHKKMGNKDMVIGFSGEGLDGYRVDYDHKKGLHVNVEMKMEDGRSIAIQPKTESKRYGFFDPDYPDENVKAEFMKFKYWIKMTLGYAVEKEAGMNDYQKIFSSFFYEQYKQYNFGSCKEKTIQRLFDFEDLAAKVKDCLNEQELAKLINAHHKIRQAFINAVLQVRSTSCIEGCKNSIDSYAMHDMDSEESDNASINSCS